MRARKELLLFGAAYLLYNAGRGLTNGDMDLAVSNAQWVIDFQGGSGVERGVQDALGGVWMFLLSHIYLAAQIVILPGVLVAMYRWAPKIYPRLRSTVIATWMLSLPIYALFPVAPPRLAGLGMTDAVSEQSAVALAGHSTWFYNPIAAVPSLHCGFAMAIGIAVAAAVQRQWLKVLALSWGPIVALSTVATANHYVFDVVAGLAITAVGYAAVTYRPHGAPSRPGARDMIRVAILDPHPAMRAGLEAILREAPGIVPVGAAADRHELWPLLYRTDPDVVLVDQVQLCLTVRGRGTRVRVSCCTRRALGFDAIVPAAFAGAAAIVDKASGTPELLAAIRGERGLPTITPRLQRRAAERLGGTDRAIFAMRLAGTRDRDIAATVGMPRRELGGRIAAIVAALIGHPLRSARSTARASSTRDDTPTLAKMLRRWVSTVFLLKKSVAAIWVFVWRSTTSRAISSSRAVSVSRPLAPLRR